MLCAQVSPLRALKERGILGSRGYRSPYLSSYRLAASQTSPAHPNQQSSSFKRPDDDIPRTFGHFDHPTGAHFLPIMDTWPEPEYLPFRARLEEQHRRRFALTIRGLTTDWCGDLGECLAKLPPELYSMVLYQLTYTTGSPPYEDVDDDERKDIKVGLSRTSLVCQAWCRIQRPKLFESIWLRDTDDVRFLLDMLRRPNNRWLPAAVTKIRILDYVSSGISTERCCRLLLPKFPSLAVFNYDGDRDHSTRQFGPSLQPVFAHHKNIRKLTLDSVLVQSLSVLVHALGDMANLEVLEVSDWPEHISRSNRAPTRMFLSSFPKLRRVRHEYHRSERLGWLFSPLLARRCKDHPEDAASGNSDAALLVLLGDLLGDRDVINRSTAMTYVEGTDTILLYNRTGSAITAGKLTLWPSASISDGKWSAIRAIECFIASRGGKAVDMIYYPKRQNLDGIDWERIDLSLAQDAIRLEKLVVHSNYLVHQQRLPSRLPKLCALGKFRVEETDSDYWALKREYGHFE